MHILKPLALLLLFASPNASGPEAALQALVADLRSQKFMSAWDRLAPEAQKKLAKGLRGRLKSEAPSDDRKVIEQFVAERRVQAPKAFDALAGLQVKIEKVERKGDTATLHGAAALIGIPSRSRIVMVKRGGEWKLRDVLPSQKRASKANEMMVIATLRNTVSAQAQFQASGVVDRNNDGTGEYGTFAEMAAAVPLRGSKRKLEPPVLVPDFGKTVDGRFTRRGYHYKIFLPGAKGVATAKGESDPRLSETVWCAYAWPVDPAATTRVFFVSQWGDVLAVDAKQYRGDKGPSPYAAFVPQADGKPVKSITGELAIGKQGSDGLVWKRAG